MVKAYHGGSSMEFQLCCSEWTNANHARKKHMLTIAMRGNDRDKKREDDNMTNWNDSNGLSKMGMCNGWSELENIKFVPLEPPPEFQDSPPLIDSSLIEKFAAKLVSKLITDALLVSCKITWSIPCSQICHMSDTLPIHGSSARWSGLRLCWTPELMTYSPCHGNRPSSRNSLSSRLSSSHNSLSVAKADDSSFITLAMSHDTLTSNQISDMYNVPFDSDIYAVPVDVVKQENPKPPPRTKKRHHRKRRQQTTEQYIFPVTPSKAKHSSHKEPLKAVRSNDIASDSGDRCGSTSRQTRSASAGCSNSEPIHLTLQEVRQYLHTLYSSSSDSSENKHLQETFKRFSNPFKALNSSENNNNNTLNNYNNNNNINNNTYHRKNNRNTIPVKNKKAKDNYENTGKDLNKFDNNEKLKKSTCRPSFSTNIKQTLCNIFRFKKLPSPDQCLGKREVMSHSDEIGVRLSGHDDLNPPSPITKPPFSKRALPPLPRFEDDHGEIIVTDSTPLPSPEEVPPPQSPPTLPIRDKEHGEQTTMDFASSIEKVKDYGWYWGPISGEAAERILSNEPDGSFIVRDSSDDYYIFSLTFKLNSIVRHVRIEHDQGNFSFGSSTRFKSHTIVDFIESAVEHSRSGRYLFFLHRRPILGPMRVQLLHPVSRFKEVQSLQHMCRFVILKYVRRDLIPNLPLPKRILEYLSTQHYYSEQFIEEDRSEYPPAKEDLDHILSVMHEGFS